MASGILETVGWAGTALVVVPIAILALDFLARGKLVGGIAFLGIIALIFAVERYVFTPGDLLERFLGGPVGLVVKSDTDDE
ncbi:MAG: DUF7533 family protein [Halorhabdus sp.]